MTGRTMEFGIKITADGRVAVTEAGRVTQSVKGIGDESRNAAVSAGKLETSLTAIGGASVVYGMKQIADAVLTFGHAMVDARVQADKLRSTLSFAFDANAAAGEMEYIAATANRLGLNLASTAQAYGKLAAAAKGTALAGEPARKVFEAIASAATVMGLSAQEADGALLAISQMISKGTVSAEELRGQLGERLPGAFQVAARAMGVTTAELGKMLEQGQLATTDFLPKFADELLKTLGDSPQSAAGQAQATLNRLSSTWFGFKQALGETGWSQLFVDEMKGMTVVLKDAAQAMEEARRRGWGGAGQTLAGVGGAIFGFDTIEEQQKRVKRAIVETEGEISALVDKYSAGHMPGIKREELQNLRTDLSGLENQLRGLTVTAGKFKLPDLSGEAKKQADAIKESGDAAMKAWGDSKLATKSEDLAKKLSTLAKEYEAAYQGALKLGKSDKELAKIVTDYTQRVTELQEAGKKKQAIDNGLDDAAREQAKSYMQQYEGAAKLARGIELEAEAGHKLLPVEQAIVAARKTLTQAQADEIEKVLAGALAIERRAMADKEWAAASLKARQDIERNLEALGAQATALENQVRYYGLTDGAIQRTIIARLDWGATNRWRMFDGKVGQQTSQADSIAVEIQTGARVDSVALFNISAATVRVQMISALDAVVYDQTFSTLNSPIVSDWYAYFFTTPVTEFLYRPDLFIIDLPPYNAAKLIVTLTDTGNTVKCGEFLFGKSELIGGTQYGARFGIQDYSVKTADAFGNYTILERAFSKRGSFSVWLTPAEKFVVQQLLTSVRATPTVFVWLEAEAESMIYGFYKDFDIELQYGNVALCSIEIEGLT